MARSIIASGNESNWLQAFRQKTRREHFLQVHRKIRKKKAIEEFASTSSFCSWLECHAKKERKLQCNLLFPSHPWITLPFLSCNSCSERLQSDNAWEKVSKWKSNDGKIVLQPSYFAHITVSRLCLVTFVCCCCCMHYSCLSVCRHHPICSFITLIPFCRFMRDDKLFTDARE